MLMFMSSNMTAMKYICHVLTELLFNYFIFKREIIFTSIHQISRLKFSWNLKIEPMNNKVWNQKVDFNMITLKWSKNVVCK